MKGLEEVVNKLKEECKNAQVTGLLLKYENIARFSLSPDNQCVLREKLKLFLSGTLPPLSGGNNLERKAALIQSFGTIVSYYHSLLPHFRANIKVASLGIQMPKMNLHNLRQASGSDLAEVPAEGPVRHPILLIFWKPILDNYPNRELAKDFITQHKELVGKIRVVSVVFNCGRGVVAATLGGPGTLSEDVEYYWMDNAETRRVKSTLTEIDSGAYFFLVVNADGKVVSSGNPQEVVLKDEVEKALSAGEVALSVSKKPMEEIKEEDEGDEGEEEGGVPEKMETGEEEIKASVPEEKKHVGVKFQHMLSYADAKGQVQTFLKEHVSELAELRKHVKAFNIRLVDEYRCKYQAEEFSHHGTSVQMRTPVSEKRLPFTQGLTHGFEALFSQFLTVYTSGPVYGPFLKLISESPCHICKQQSGQFLCLKCAGHSYCPDCFFSGGYIVPLTQNNKTLPHKHLIHYLPAKYASSFYEIVPRRKNDWRKLASKTPLCGICKDKWKDKGTVCVACDVCLTGLVMCQKCFMGIYFTHVMTEAGVKECAATHPHHDFDAHTYICIPAAIC